MEKVQLILDTDMDTDCDDAGALAVLNNYLIKGRVDVKAVICDAPSEYGGSCIEAINRYYGSSVPIGVVKPEDFGADYAARFQNYLAHQEKTSARNYNCAVGSLVGRTASGYPSAASAYRKVLSECPDQSVVICCIGLLSAISLLLASGPDEHSPLTGVELVAQKVRYIVTMASMPFPGQGNERFNWKMDALAAEHVVNSSPVPLHISSTGVDVRTGSSLSDLLPPDHPVRRAYEIYLGVPNKSRSSWDQIALLYAMNQDEPLFRVSSGYRISYSAQENLCSWIPGKSGRQDCFIELAVEEPDMADKIEALMSEF